MKNTESAIATEMGKLLILIWESQMVSHRWLYNLFLLHGSDCFQAELEEDILKREKRLEKVQMCGSTLHVLERQSNFVLLRCSVNAWGTG